MDANKLKVLKEVGYVIPEQCGFCQHFQSTTSNAAYGTCAVKTYDHLKHTGPARQLSVFRHGVCQDDSFKKRADVDFQLGTWAELFERREHPRSTRHKTKTRY